MIMLLTGLVGTSSAGFEDFEGIPDDYWRFAGNQNLGETIPGLEFGPHVVILEQDVYGYHDHLFPPHSPVSVAYTYEWDFIGIAFTEGTVNHVGLWYTCQYGTGLYLEAYDEGENLIDEVNGPINVGFSNYFEINAPGISYVVVHDSGNYFTIDDLDYTLETPAAEEDWTQLKSTY